LYTALNYKKSTVGMCQVWSWLQSCNTV